MFRNITLKPSRHSSSNKKSTKPLRQSLSKKNSTLSVIKYYKPNIFHAHTRQKVNIPASEPILRTFARDTSNLIRQYPNKMLQFSESEIYQTLIDNNAVLAINHQRKCVGFLQIKLWQNYLDEKQLPFVEICSAIIQSDYRGKGLCKFLFHEMLTTAREKYPQHRLIAIMNEKDNPAMQNLLGQNAIQVPLEPNFPQIIGNEAVYEFPSKRLYRYMQQQLSYKITLGFFNFPCPNFYDKYHIVDPSCSFVKNETYKDVTAERLREPSKNCLTLYPKLLPILNNITKLSFGSKEGLGETYIAKQLQNCKELILIRNRGDASISHYLRFDVFYNLPSAPCGLAMFKVPSLPDSNIITDLTLHILKDELESRVTILNLNPTSSLILRTDNPRIYQMRAKLTDKIYPDLHKVKDAIDMFFVLQIKTFIQNNQTETINELLQKKLIMRNDRIICHTLEDVKSSLPSLSLNLQSLKKYQDDISHIINLLTCQLNKIYKDHIPSEYADTTRNIIKKLFSHHDLHNYDLLIAKDTTPKIKINKNKEHAHDPIINDFYEYYLRSNTRDYLMINFEIDLAGINKKLSKSKEKIYNKMSV